MLCCPRVDFSIGQEPPSRACRSAVRSLHPLSTRASSARIIRSMISGNFSFSHPSRMGRINSRTKSSSVRGALLPRGNSATRCFARRTAASWAKAATAALAVASESRRSPVTPVGRTSSRDCGLRRLEFGCCSNWVRCWTVPVVAARIRQAEDFSGARGVGCWDARVVTRDALLDLPEDLVHRWFRREACIQHALPPDPVCAR
jgi:hypothetical protein